MDWLNLAASFLAVGVSAAAFWRTLLFDRVVADLTFEWEATLGRVVGKLVIDNPLRQSVYLRGIRCKKPSRERIRLSPEGSGLHDTISEAYETHIGPNRDVIVINTRIPPRGSVVLNMYIEEEETDLEFSFEWSKAMLRVARFLMPSDCSYSAKDLRTMKLAAKRGEEPKP